MNEPRVITLGGHSFTLTFWQDIELSEKLPQHRCNVIVDVGLTFDLDVVTGAAEEAAWKDKLVGGAQRASGARVTSHLSEHVFGMTFSGVRFEQLQEFGPDVVRELYFMKAGQDLLAFAYTINRAKNPNEAEWRRHLLSMAVTAASVPPPQPKKPAWKFW